MAEATAFVPILKMDKTPDGTLIVEGVATDSSVDRDQQIADPAWLDRAMPQWFTEGGNVREQHNPRIAAGVALAHEKNDAGQHVIRAEIVDPGTVKKIEKKVLRGFSFSARDARVAFDKQDAPGGRIVDGTIYSVDVVDRPANPNCQFRIAKADGTGEWAPEVLVDEPTYTPSDLARILDRVKADGDAPGVVEKKDYSDKQRANLADKGHALPDGSFPIATKGDLANAINDYGRAKDKAVAKAHIIKRARALGAVDKLPPKWGVDKADAILADIRTLVPGALAKAEGDGADPAYDPDTEASDVDAGTSAIAAIARLIISEAEGLAAGRMEEIWDIKLLIDAACALQCFVGNETYQEVELMSDTPKADAPAEETGSEPATTETTDVDKTDDGQHDTATIADLTKAMDAYKDELDLVKAELAQVKATPIPGGPVRTRTHVQKAVSDQRDALSREVQRYEAIAEKAEGGLSASYAQLAEKRRAQLAELDKVDG